ncbi:hypothetical protein FSP39_015903 [Pinctada imbricata]|uniref:Uncharacterized protein n=1 Tax=Pinctada imbricata TaxID=66713 RepID=A0AA88YTL9_PINIB|nr:hypothetical protein FSP39_015903 [Pinctada imbricata]
MDPLEIQDDFYYTVYNTDDYKIDRRKPYGLVLKELELLPFPKNYMGCKLMRQVKMQSLQDIAARAVIRECKHPLKRELLLEQIPHPIRIFINQVHVDMLDYWIESVSRRPNDKNEPENYRRISNFAQFPEYYRYTATGADVDLFRRFGDHHTLYEYREIRRMCKRYNHKCALFIGDYMPPYQRVLYCHINGDCLCPCEHEYDCKCLVDRWEERPYKLQTTYKNFRMEQTCEQNVVAAATVDDTKKDVTKKDDDTEQRC